MPEHHRASLACEGNDLMTVFNLHTHQPIAFLPMAGGPDVIKFDSGLKRIYVACSSGAISVFQMDDPDHYRKLEDFPVQKKVHTLQWTPTLTVSTRRSRKRTAKPWRAWSYTTP